MAPASTTCLREPWTDFEHLVLHQGDSDFLTSSLSGSALEDMHLATATHDSKVLDGRSLVDVD